MGRPSRRPRLAPWSAGGAELHGDSPDAPWPNVRIAARFAAFVLFGPLDVNGSTAYDSATRPALILICGLPGSGKSYVARELATRLPLLVVGSDRVRRLLFTRPTYSAREHGIVHGVCYQLVEWALRQRRTVVFDATNLRVSTRRRYAALAREHDAVFQLILTEATDATIRERLRRRTRREVDDGSEADEAIYDLLRQSAEPLALPYYRVASDADVAAVAARVIERVGLLQTSTSMVS